MINEAIKITDISELVVWGKGGENMKKKLQKKNTLSLNWGQFYGENLGNHCGIACGLSW